VCHGNPWDLKGCQRKQGEPLRDYIRCFSQKSHELPSVADADVVLAFWDGTTCHSLVHELSHEQPKTAKELLNIATRHASGEEAIGATFTLVEVGVAAGSGRTTPPNITIKGTKKGTKGGKKGQKHRPHHLSVMANNDNVGEEIEDSNEFMVAAERGFKRHTKPPKDHFKKILEATCPHHPYPIKHKLRDCTMMKRFMSSTGTPPGGDELARDLRGEGTVLRKAEASTITG
jgi:hypothetical protein